MSDEKALFMPMVTEIVRGGERGYDLFSRLLKDRIVFIGSAIEPTISSVFIAQLLYLEYSDPGKPIHVYIQSPGGQITAGMAMIDVMNFISSPVYTYCLGMCASMGALILTCGEKGHRYCLPNAEVMVHQPSGGTHGQATDIAIAAAHITRTKQRINQLMAERTGQPIEKIAQDTERDRWLTAEEAKEYGLIDEVIVQLPSSAAG